MMESAPPPPPAAKPARRRGRAGAHGGEDAGGGRVDVGLSAAVIVVLVGGAGFAALERRTRGREARAVGEDDGRLLHPQATLVVERPDRRRLGEQRGVDRRGRRSLELELWAARREAELGTALGLGCGDVQGARRGAGRRETRRDVCQSLKSRISEYGARGIGGLNENRPLDEFEHVVGGHTEPEPAHKAEVELGVGVAPLGIALVLVLVLVLLCQLPPLIVAGGRDAGTRALLFSPSHPKGPKESKEV